MRRLVRRIAVVCVLAVCTPAGALQTDAHRDVVVDAPEAIEVLRAGQLGLAQLLFGQSAQTNADLAKLPGWAGVLRVVTEAVAAQKKGDRQAGVGMRFSHRLFDVRWLRATEAQFALIGVVNRIDRAPFAPEGCGETRLIYRLMYQHSTETSFLPMTVNLVFRQPGTCFEAWKRWPWDASRHPELLTQANGALAPALLTPEHLLAVELNLQTVRWPSTAKPDLGGHAAYALRVLRPQADGPFAPGAMENQLDVQRLQRDTSLRARLVAWLREPTNLQAIDAGTAVVPEAFLAKAATSVAPRGLARLANRPFRQVLSPADLADVDLQRFAGMPTPSAVLRRLDTLSCTGCHQSNSLAGFHLLGQEPAGPAPGKLAVGRSPHLIHEVAARQADMDRWPEVPPPRRLDPADMLDAGMPNGPCALKDDGVACMDLPASHMRCVQVDDDEMGVCLPESGDLGAICEAGQLETGPRAEADHISHATALPCPPAAVCNSSRAGFPAGVCVGACANPPDGTTCTGIPQLTPFNRCLARKQPFAACVASTAVDVLVRGCSERTPCRSDFVCSRGPQGQGACMPAYFLHQLRVDGHPALR